MKGKSLFAAVVLPVAALCGCTSNNQFANEVAGSWASNEISLDMPAPEIVNITDLFDFTLDEADNATGGTVIMSGQLSVETPAEGDEVDMTYAYSAAATATMSGTWNVVKDDGGTDDEILIMLDPSTFTVNVDPDAVVMRSNILTDEQSPAVDSIPPVLLNKVRTIATHAAERHFLIFRKLEDVKIDKSVMTFEVKDVAYRLEKQGSAE